MAESRLMMMIRIMRGIHSRMTAGQTSCAVKAILIFWNDHAQLRTDGGRGAIQVGRQQRRTRVIINSNDESVVSRGRRCLGKIVPRPTRWRRRRSEKVNDVSTSTLVIIIINNEIITK